MIDGPMITVDPVEARILGVLVEKQMTTPDSYPLTLAAVVAGCNQSTNRHPVMDLSQEEVERTLVGLHDRSLATPVRRPGDRATKYRHKLVEAFDLDERATAVLAVLLLRGSQTTGELRQRTDRYVDFGAVEEVEGVVDEMESLGLARRLPRRPGQSQRRVAELLTASEDEGLDPGASGPMSPDDPASGPTTPEPADPRPPISDPDPDPGESGGDLERRMSDLEERFDELLRRLGVDDL